MSSVAFRWNIAFVVAYLAIRKLKDKETGITFKAARGSETDVLTNFEALVVATQVDLKPMESQSKMPLAAADLVVAALEKVFSYFLILPITSLKNPLKSKSGSSVKPIRTITKSCEGKTATICP